MPDVPAPGQDSARRALDRRALAAGYGCREAATSLKAAFARAEDLIYIETPALDSSSFGEAGDTLAVWQALLDRLDANRALRVVVCVPIQPFFGCPTPMKTVRDAKLLEAAADSVQRKPRGEIGDLFAERGTAAQSAAVVDHGHRRRRLLPDGDDSSVAARVELRFVAGSGGL